MGDIPTILKIHKDSDLVLNMRVAGTTFVDDNREMLSAIKRVPRDKLSLSFKREPTNEYDPNAVMVFIKVEGFDKSRFVGYIPRDYSELVSYVIQNRDTYRFLVTPPELYGGVEGKENIGIFFNLKIERRDT